MNKRNPLNKISTDELAALQNYAGMAGSEWKDSLRRDWLRGGSDLVGPAAYTLLHRLRNRLGPRWLDKVALPSGA